MLHRSGNVRSAVPMFPDPRRTFGQKRLSGFKPSGFHFSLVLLLASIFVENFLPLETHADLSFHSTEDRSLAANGRPKPATLSEAIIEPGKSVGRLRLGDTRESVVSFFTFKQDMDAEYKYPGSRSEIHWLDTDGNQVRGEISVFLRDGRVVQIASATPRFRTQTGITLFGSADVVKSHYHGLEAYVFLNSGGEDVGGRDLIYWINREEGIAFEFHYYPKVHRRRVYSVIVFPAGTEFFPRNSYLPPEQWRALPAYSLEPPPSGSAR